MFADGELVFTLVNDYQADFTYGRNALRTTGPSGGSWVVNRSGVYIQASYPSDIEFTGFRNSVYPASMADVAGLEPRVSQEGATVSLEATEDHVNINVSEIDTTQPLEIYLGNVLTVYMSV